MMELSLLDWTLWLMKVTKAVLNLHHRYHTIYIITACLMQLMHVRKEGLS